MNRSERTVLVVLILLLLLGLFFWRLASGPKSPAPGPEEVHPSSATIPSPLPTTPPKEAARPKSIMHPKSALPATTPTGAPVPPKLELHKELIPKNIEIILEQSKKVAQFAQAQSIAEAIAAFERGIERPRNPQDAIKRDMAIARVLVTP